MQPVMHQIVILKSGSVDKIAGNIADQVVSLVAVWRESNRIDWAGTWPQILRLKSILQKNAGNIRLLEPIVRNANADRPKYVMSEF